MKAVILAGGEGTRLRPLTCNTPKPMMPLVNKPMMEHIVALLALHGFDEIVVTVAFLANQIRDYFGDGSDFGVSMRYATEDTPLGTAGSVRNASAELDDTFLVISGDVLTDIDLTAFVKAHRDASASASIALKHVDNPLEFGIVITQSDGSIERFLEKPSWGEVFSDTINTGIYVLEPDVFDFIADNEVVDFSGDVFPALLEAGHTMHGHVIDDYWEDVGTSRPTSACTPTSSTVTCGSTSTASGSPKASGSAPTSRSAPKLGSTGPSSSATAAASRRVRTCASTRCSVPT